MLRGVSAICGIAIVAAAPVEGVSLLQNEEASRPSPASRFLYQLRVDPKSLPAGVAARARSVPGSGQIQTWIRNDGETPFVILAVNRRGEVVRRQKLVGSRVYIEVAPRAGRAGAERASKWQLIEGANEALLTLNYTPDGIVAGRSSDKRDISELPSPEPFSIEATFGGEKHPISGEIVYSRASAAHGR